jgi:serine/threonine protein kinase
LTDFGESRSDEIQTHLVANIRVKNVNQGTPSFMAPELKVANAVGADDLRRIDMRAYGMVIYLNRDAKFPFYFDAKEARESWVGPERFDVLAFLEENIPKQKKPKHSSKYHQLHQTREWRTLADIYEICTEKNDDLKYKRSLFLFKLFLKPSPSLHHS